MDQTLWGTSSPPKKLLIKIEDTYMEDIITQMSTDGHSDFTPSLPPKVVPPAHPRER